MPSRNSCTPSSFRAEPNQQGKTLRSHTSLRIVLWESIPSARYSSSAASSDSAMASEASSDAMSAQCADSLPCRIRRISAFASLPSAASARSILLIQMNVGI